MIEACLIKADIDLTELVGANLENADLEDANFMNWVNFSAANLHGALIEQEELNENKFHLKGAILPDGSIHP